MSQNIKICVLGVALYAAAALSAPFPGQAQPVTARATEDFLNSVGVVSTLPDRGQSLEGTIGMLRYIGFRWLRGGIEGLTEMGPTTIDTYLQINRAAGVKIAWGLVSGGSDLDKLLSTGRVLARNNALLAFEGNNEPNNWGVIYNGEKGGQSGSWLPVAKLQADLYARVKSDVELAEFPVWSISEPGGQTDNAGLQFLQIPPDADTLMPRGTRFADFANVHNYMYHPNSPYPANNKTWNAAEPSKNSPVDGLHGNYGVTWAKQFQGYTDEQLTHLPRVTTETGVAVGGKITEELHASHLVNVYLSQFSRGYAFTSVYLLRDREDEGGNQAFGFFRADYTPRKAAEYLRNLMQILADRGRRETRGKFRYSVLLKPETVHDLLLQKSDGTFQLVLWAERVDGSEVVEVHFGEEVSQVDVHDVATGTMPVRTLRNVDRVTVELHDSPVV
ncbi:MAG: glycosyl hydrolase, partial [Alphaproteobacteria bacterium]